MRRPTSVHRRSCGSRAARRSTAIALSSATTRHFSVPTSPGAGRPGLRAVSGLGRGLRPDERNELLEAGDLREEDRGGRWVENLPRLAPLPCGEPLEDQATVNRIGRERDGAPRERGDNFDNERRRAGHFWSSTCRWEPERPCGTLRCCYVNFFRGAVRAPGWPLDGSPRREPPSWRSTS